MIELTKYGVENVGVREAIINCLEEGLEFDRDERFGECCIPKSLKVSGNHIGLIFPPDSDPPIQSNDNFIAAFESYVEYAGLYYEIHYSVI